jgi:mono/diheme cytochrome c family protein
MKATFERYWKVLVVFAAVMLVATLPPSQALSRTNVKSDDYDAAAVYKTKCAMCHGQKAEKKFDGTLPDDQLVAAILTGKKGEKPPNMPEFQTKGVTADQATALIAYMKSLKQ